MYCRQMKPGYSYLQKAAPTIKLTQWHKNPLFKKLFLFYFLSKILISITKNHIIFSIIRLYCKESTNSKCRITDFLVQRSSNSIPLYENHLFAVLFLTKILLDFISVLFPVYIYNYNFKIAYFLPSLVARQYWSNI